MKGDKKKRFLTISFVLTAVAMAALVLLPYVLPDLSVTQFVVTDVIIVLVWWGFGIGNMVRYMKDKDKN